MLKKLKLILALVSVAILVGLGIYCAVPLTNPVPGSPMPGDYYVWRVDDTSPEEATRLVINAIVTELSRSAKLAEDYPRLGRVRVARPGEESDQCILESLEGYADCILLNEDNEFVRISFRTDPSPALHYFTVYILHSWSLWNRVDPNTTGRLEIDVAAKSGFVAEAIGDGLRTLGVREYSP